MLGNRGQSDRFIVESQISTCKMRVEWMDEKQIRWNHTSKRRVMCKHPRLVSCESECECNARLWIKGKAALPHAR